MTQAVILSLRLGARVTNLRDGRCGAGCSSGQRSPAGPRRLGTATRMNASLSRRLSAFFESAPRPRLKSGKVRRSDTRPGEVCERAERSEGSDSAPTRNAPVSPCDPLCAILLAKVSVYPPQPFETSVAAFVPEVLKTVRPMCWKRWYDCVSCAFAAFPRTKKKAG